MSNLSVIDTIINITIWVLLFWFISNIYILIVFIFNSANIYGILFDWQFFGSDMISYAHRFLLILANLFLCFVLSLLGWIFVFWMIILIFVPFIVPIFIPFIPFIIPIPLKFLMLYFIPPFRILTERGILPLCLRLLLIFVSTDAIKTKFSRAFKETYGFFYDDAKNIVGDLAQNPETSISQYNNDTDKIPSVDNENNNKEEAKKLMKNDEMGRNKEVMDLIDEELQLCLKSKQTFTTPDTNKSLTSASDMNNYLQCYSQSATAYFKNKI